MLAARHRARLAMAETNPDSQEAKLKSVRRRLNFGDTNDDNLPSKEELERKFEEERLKELEEKKSKWNFDFKEGRPLEGRWEWVPVAQSEKSIEATASAAAAAPGGTDADTESAQRDAEDQAP